MNRCHVLETYFYKIPLIFYEITVFRSTRSLISTKPLLDMRMSGNALKMAKKVVQDVVFQICIQHLLNVAFKFAKFSETFSKLSVDIIPASSSGKEERIFPSLTTTIPP